MSFHVCTCNGQHEKCRIIAELREKLDIAVDALESGRNILNHVMVELNGRKESDLGLQGLYETVRDSRRETDEALANLRRKEGE